MSACHQWKVQETAPSQVVGENEPDRIRLTMLDGNRFELADASVSNGEIVGQPPSCRDRWNRRYVMCDTLRVPADSVARIEIREADAFATSVAVLFGLAAALAVWVVVAFSDWEY